MNERHGTPVRLVLAATRVWLPLTIAVAGVVAVVMGRGHTALAGAGVVLLGSALIVWMLNWLFRMSLDSNLDREREEAARRHFDIHGVWPEDDA